MLDSYSTFTVLTRNLLISVQREKRRQNSIKIQARKNKRSSRVFQRFSQKTERRRGKKFIASLQKRKPQLLSSSTLHDEYSYMKNLELGELLFS